MANYHDFHLKCVVLLFADVFVKYRNSSLKLCVMTESIFECTSFKLKCLVLPALSWDTMLCMAEVELELISDADLYLFFEKGMRGGFSFISKRYKKTSNKYLNFYDLK